MNTTDRVAAELDACYESYRVREISVRKFQPEEFHSILDGVSRNSQGSIRIRGIGESFEGRPIRLVTIGTGPTKVLCWSQMHGDESTATMAIADILNYFARAPHDAFPQEMLNALTISFLPLLNPDGAARFQRRTAQSIDMNRDAIALVTPEARILNRVHHELKPHVGFNLHDQELSTVGTTKELSAIALLAPAFDATKMDNDVRARAKRIAAAFATSLHRWMPGRISRYDDTFEPRAFGDTVQKWGTSTVLVESGHTFNDPEKASIRKLNFVGMLSTFATIARNELESVEMAAYETLPFNSKRAYDIIVRNVTIDHERGLETTVDLGISYQVDTHSEATPRLVDLGDLQPFVGLREIDASGKHVPHERLQLGQPFEWEEFLG